MILFTIVVLPAVAYVFYSMGYQQGEQDGYINAMNDGWGGNVNE
jgi:hypothetical protein